MANYRVPNLDTFDFQQPVLDKDLTAPPGSPAKGNRYIVNAAGGATWFGVSGSNLDSNCGDQGGGYTCVGALNGTECWLHYTDETHWFIIDLGSSKSINKIRGRSNATYDPTVINVYVSDSKVSWGAAVASNITTWKNTDNWVEISISEKSGRYIKVEITATENVRALKFGNVTTPFKIFDVETTVIATGVWAGHDKDITYYDGSNWQFITPEEGWLIYLADENKYYMFNGTSWVVTAII